MLRLVADENLDNDLIRGLLHRSPGADIVRIQDVGLSGRPDDEVLAWAAREGRVLLTQDLRTVPRYAYERVRAGSPMPGVIATSQRAAAGQVLEDLVLLVEHSRDGEWEGQVLYLPLRS